MSWSYSFKGDAKACMDDYHQKMAQMSKLAEPEQTARSQVFAALENILQPWPANRAVEVSMWGSQSVSEEGTINTLHVDVKVPTS
jgi:hypothetical protein